MYKDNLMALEFDNFYLAYVSGISMQFITSDLPDFESMKTAFLRGKQRFSIALKVNLV